MKLRARFAPILALAFSLICARQVSATILTVPIAIPTKGHTYYLLAQTNWTAAEAEAVSLGGHLATVNDATENEWIRVTFSNFGGVGRDAWIGLTDVAQEGAWVWINGEPVTYFNWNSGEPNNGAGYYPQEDQVVLLSNGKWNDAADYLTN